MTPESVLRLANQLRPEEEFRASAYQDSLGYWTIGYGRLIDQRKGGRISEIEAEYLLANDIKDKLAELEPYAWYKIQDEVRQVALADMTFNLGISGLLHFPKFLMHMGLKEYPAAVAELVGTAWHSQVGARADRIIRMIETGAWT